MSTGALLAMILVMGTVVGGFLFFVRLAAKKEKKSK